jgi:molecular chaperone GrpE (heat shock protein)
MSHKRHVWETFTELAQRLLSAAETTPPPGSAEVDRVGLDEIAQDVRRLSKVQFKANALQEAALDQLRQAADQRSIQEQEALQQAETDTLHDLLTALVPILDGLEAALDSGERLLAQPNRDPADDQWVARRLDGTDRDRDEDREDTARLVHQSERTLMAAWLEGLRLVRERLLALLAAAGVEPIPAVGQPFNPYLHNAVGTANDNAQAPGVIVAEQRRGYTGPAGVLRYADVIVSRATGNPETRGTGLGISNHAISKEENELEG